MSPGQKVIVMSLIDQSNRRDIAAAVAQATQQIEGSDEALATSFVRQYYADLTEDDFAERRPEEWAAMAQRHLAYGRQRRLAETIVHVDRPDVAGHGVLCVVTDDAPFLVDTVRLVLERFGLSIYSMVHPMLNVTRNGDGQLVGAEEGLCKEAWTQIEIERCTAEVATDLALQVRLAIERVHLAVNDFAAMKDMARRVSEDMAANPGLGHTATESDQVSKLLIWLVKKHFVFLGAASYDLVAGDLLIKRESSLGLLRDATVADPVFAATDFLVSIVRADAEIELERRTRPVCIAVRRIGPQGQVVGEERFVGLFAASAYRAPVGTIPLIRERIAWVESRSKTDPSGYVGRTLHNVLETFPRDELFEIRREELAEVVAEIMALQDRSTVRVVELRSPESGWQTLAVYLPRNRMTAELPRRVAQHISFLMGATGVEFDSLVTSSPLARIKVEIRRTDAVTRADLDRLTLEVDQFTQRWDDQLRASLLNELGEEQADLLVSKYAGALPADYVSVTAAPTAVQDLLLIDEMLTSGESTATRIVNPGGEATNERRFRLYRRNSPITLAEMLPLLDQLGLQAIDERPFVLAIGADSVSVYDVGVRLIGTTELPHQISAELQRTFLHLLNGSIESDGLNRLVLGAGLSGRHVEILRAYTKYLRQISFPFSQAYIEATLAKHPAVARLMIQLFVARFQTTDELIPDPQTKTAMVEIRNDIDRALGAIPSLDEDRICRAFLQLINATVRTNALRVGDDGEKLAVIAFKFDPKSVPDLPLPRPMFEIWVSSPRVEGVHLRGGRIARGGIRWSDRREDFRTEVLGLMKAQMVKNSVIVPVGAKGGFVVKRPPSDPDALRQEVLACYSEFIAGLLDLTDNLIDGSVVPPPNTLRYDADDPYLVVAADKGTATFSDVANRISERYDFWLGDAFASGGSVGYDHKVMGITARGAWESVRRHAQTLGKNADRDPLTIIGVGDMSGDVFGNGLLRSNRLQLVAAFDHRHVFLDPDPDPARSFDERQRLFNLPRSSWADYDASLISAGGGVFARSEKSISLSPQVRRRLGVDASSLTPNELMAVILRSPVDILWNGGIGTYVKASTESHADVGDRANDAIRINGNEMRCRIVGEGGNLGFTQRGRVEYALNGGLINTDAIDNSAGVDCSDHEVNIKILLNACVQRGELTVLDRNTLLASMTEEVGELVLDDNRAQTLALAIARRQSVSMVNVHTRYLNALETEGWLNRGLEFLPTDRQLAERQAAGQGLTTPEFAVLLAYTKNANLVEILATDLPDDPYFNRDLVAYFPTAMRDRYRDEILGHQLHREIVATQLVNQMVNLSGISFDHRMTEQTGASVVDITRAWVVARDVAGLQQIWNEIELLDGDVKLDGQLELLLEARRMVERGVLWLLRHRRPPIDLLATTAEFIVPMQALSTQYDEVVRGQLAATVHSVWAGQLAAGVPESLAERASSWPLLHTAYDVIDIAERHHRDPVDIAGTYWHLFEALDVLWLWDGIGALPRSTRWETQARSALRDDLLAGLASLTEDVLRSGVSVDDWLAVNERSVGRVAAMFNEVRRSDMFDITTLTVGLRQLSNLALTTS